LYRRRPPARRAPGANLPWPSTAGPRGRPHASPTPPADARSPRTASPRTTSTEPSSPHTRP
jgi:hypothetical protein